MLGGSDDSQLLVTASATQRQMTELEVEAEGSQLDATATAGLDEDRRDLAGSSADVEQCLHLVVIGLEPVPGISLSNKIPCEILAVTSGKLLTSLELKGPSGNIHSVISTRSAKALNLVPGKAVWAMIKLNELMLLPQ